MKLTEILKMSCAASVVPVCLASAIYLHGTISPDRIVDAEQIKVSDTTGIVIYQDTEVNRNNSIVLRKNASGTLRFSLVDNPPFYRQTVYVDQNANGIIDFSQRSYVGRPSGFVSTEYSISDDVQQLYDEIYEKSRFKVNLK